MPEIGPVINRNSDECVGYIYMLCKDINDEENHIIMSSMSELVNSLFDAKISNSYKDAIINSIIDGIIAVDKKGKIVTANENFTRMLELTKENIIGRNINELFRHEDNFLRVFSPHERLVTDKDIVITLPENQTKKSFTISSHCLSFLKQGFEGRVIVMNDEKRTSKVVKQRAGLSAKYSFDDIICADLEFQQVIALAKKAAKTDANVLIVGESGSGKEMFAQAIHNLSARNNAPFVAINCAAIPKDLIESELFGYVDGAFTGAQRGGSFGKFDLANDGTLFLDEIGDMPLKLQAVLLRAIEEKMIMRIGGKESIPVNVRFIAATNQELKKTIREDLFYRLAVFKISIPPLRDRKDDIVKLTKYYVEKYSRRYQKRISVDPRVFDVLVSYHWPGNVRELQNVIESVCAVISDNGTVTADLLPSEMISNNNIQMKHHPVSSKNINLNKFQKEEKDLLEKLLKFNQGNISNVAKELGVARSTIYRKMQRYSLDRYL